MRTFRVLTAIALAMATAVSLAGPASGGLPPTTTFSLETIDGSGTVGQYSSLALDRDGVPVVSYYEDAAKDLKVAKCSDPGCTGPIAINTVDGEGGENVGRYTSLALDAKGNPVISYTDDTNGLLRVAHCNDPRCSGGDESIEIVDEPGFDFGLHTSLALDAKGNPVVSHYRSGDSLWLTHCNDPNCAGDDESNEVVDSDGDPGQDSSLALDGSGRPVISYYDADAMRLMLAHCNDPKCAGGNESISDVAAGGQYTSLELDAKGNPVVSYTNGVTLRVLHCNDPNCVGGNESGQSIGTNAEHTSLALDASGDPVVAHYDFDAKDLRVVHCNDPNCAGNNERAQTVDSAGAVGQQTSVALRGGQYPVVTYLDFDNGNLKAAFHDAPPPFYVMVEQSGVVHAFPPSQHVGDAPVATGFGAVARDVAINHEGTGYYVLDSFGIVHAIGPNTMNRGNVDLGSLKAGETPVAMALTGSGKGYWIFTNLGSAFPFGDAPDIGDVSGLALQGAIVDAAPYPPGYYMGAADGGVFTPLDFVGSQEVPFYGSMGGVPLNEPIVTIYIDAVDLDGYSLAAADGGMFNFRSEFCGAIPGILPPGGSLNQPVVNAVPYGNCYIFFAADGGAFVFGDKPFLGSLGDNPPPTPIVSGDAYAT